MSRIPIPGPEAMTDNRVPRVDFSAQAPEARARRVALYGADPYHLTESDRRRLAPLAADSGLRPRRTIFRRKDRPDG